MKAYRLLFVVLSLLLILFGLGSAVLLVVEPFIPNGVAGLLLAFLLSQRMVMTGVLTVALIGFGLWALTRRSPDGTETRDPRVLLAGQKRRMAIVFALFLIGSIAIAVQYMRDLREAADEQGAKLVSDIVALKEIGRAHV